MGNMTLSECFRWYKKRIADVPTLQVKKTIAHIDTNGQGYYEEIWQDVPHVEEEEKGDRSI